MLLQLLRLANGIRRKRAMQLTELSIVSPWRRPISALRADVRSDRNDALQRCSGSASAAGAVKAAGDLARAYVATSCKIAARKLCL